MNKYTSYYINLLLLLGVGLAFAFGRHTLPHQILLSVGLFGLSGSLTNSLAIHMLFERIPFVYGSGIIALNFAEIKLDLEELMVAQFFNSQQIERFLAEEIQAVELDLSQLGGLLDYDLLFDKFKATLSQSFQRNPLAMMAMPLLEANRARIIAAMRSAVDDELQKPSLLQQIKELLPLPSSADFAQRVRALIRQRLAELTAPQVKDMIQHMMASKLVWLVVWGALLGALMGLFSALLRFFLGF